MVTVPELETITTWIRNARQKAGISSKKLATQSAISQSAMSKLEKGRLEPSYKLIYRVTKALDELISVHGTRVKVGDRMVKNVKILSPTAHVSQAKKIIKENGFSQLPIIDRNGKIVGLLTEKSLLDHPDASACDEAIESDYAVVGPEMDFEKARQIAKNTNALLVTKEGRLIGILTKSDFL